MHQNGPQNKTEMRFERQQKIWNFLNRPVPVCADAKSQDMVQFSDIKTHSQLSSAISLQSTHLPETSWNFAIFLGRQIKIKSKILKKKIFE